MTASPELPPPAQRPPWQRALYWSLSRIELGWLILFSVVGAALWVFIEVTDEVLEGEAQAIDRAILLAMRSEVDPADPIGPRWFEEMARDLTALGGLAVLTWCLSRPCFT